MPYNPGVQDISGQLLAQGMMQRTQALTGLVGDFLKMEDERQKTTGVLKGFLSDPYYQQQVNTNPELSAFAQKVQKGNASLSDVRQFLGTMTTMQGVREQQMKEAQMQSQQAYTQALRDQAIATAAATQAAAEERRQQIENEKIANEILSDVLQFGAEATEEDMPSPQRSVQDIRRQYLEAGGPMTPGVVDFLRQMGQQELGQARLDAATQEKIERLEDQIQTLKGAAATKIPLGEKRVFTMPGGAKVQAEMGPEGWIEPNSGLPIYTTTQALDPKTYTVVTRKDVPNPLIFGEVSPMEVVEVKTPIVDTGTEAPKKTEKTTPPPAKTPASRRFSVVPVEGAKLPRPEDLKFRNQFPSFFR